MRSVPLYSMKQGINRLRTRAGANAASLYDLVNAYITVDGSIKPREGTDRFATLTASTKGLMADDGEFNVFSITQVTVPTGFIDNILLDPNDSTQAIEKIWFAKPFMGFPYVVAEFANGDVFHYWLQNSGTWKANTVYDTGTLILPATDPTGLAYQATRVSPANPNWVAETSVALGTIVEPNEYTGYMYKAVAVAGSTPHTSSTEPVWPTASGGTVQEFGDFDTSSTDSGTTQTDAADAASGSTPLSATITDRYGDSSTIANSGGSTDNAVTLPTAASTNVSTWQKGTLYAPGAVVQPSNTQGAFLNAIPNGDFENGNDGSWVLTAGVNYSATNPYQGTECLQMTANNNEVTATMNTYGAVTPGQSVTATGYVNPNSSGADLSMGLSLIWYDSTGTRLSNVNSAFQQNGGYRQVTVTGVAPPNAAQVRVQIFAGNGTSSKTGYADLISWNLETAAPVSNFLYEAVQAAAGASGSAEPAWPTVAGNTVVDNQVTWKAIGTSIITWEAIPIMLSGATEPAWPTSVPLAVHDTSAFVDSLGDSNNTSISWVASSRQITDTNNPNTVAVALNSSHVFAVDKDIVPYSAAVNPTDWTSANNAGYLPTGLNNYGDNPAAVLALYRSNLMVFNAGGYQMWQTDPDPANMAILDAQPIGSIYPLAAQSVSNDLLFLTEVGVRNLGTVGATANMAIGSSGQPVDPLVVAELQADEYIPLSLYYPGRGQYWLIFGPQAFVFTVNGSGMKSWSRYVFPDTITDWTLSEGVLYLRTAGNLVWELDATALVDDKALETTGAFSITTGYENTGEDLDYTGYSSAAFAALEGYPTLGTETGTLSGYTVAGFFQSWVPEVSNALQLALIGAPTTLQFSVTFTDGNGYVTVLTNVNAVSATAVTIGGQAATVWEWTSATFPRWISLPAFSYPQTINFASVASITGGENIAFDGIIQTPYLDVGPIGLNKSLIGLDITGDGEVAIQIGWAQNDPTTFNDNPGFSTSQNVTPPYTIDAADTVPGQPIPFPMIAPSFTVILIFSGNQAWSWQASNLYLTDMRGAGAT